MKLTRSYKSTSHLAMRKQYPLKTQTRSRLLCSICQCKLCTRGSSSTTKVRAAFDASAKSSSGVSLNDTLLVGPTIHPPFLEVLLRFGMHRVALTADVSKMYRAVELAPSNQDFHCFVWRSEPSQILKDYGMTRATFGVSTSCFAANMAVKAWSYRLPFMQNIPLTVNRAIFMWENIVLKLFLWENFRG